MHVSSGQPVDPVGLYFHLSRSRQEGLQSSVRVGEWRLPCAKVWVWVLKNGLAALSSL